MAIPRAFTEAGMVFAVAYVTAQVSRPAILLLALGRHQFRRLKLRMLVTFSATGVLWITGALLPTGTRVGLWASALALEYLAARAGWPVPGLGGSTISRWDIAGEHLAERYQQFFLVALGETILVIGLAYSTGSYDPAPTAAFAVAVVTSVLLWRIYVQRAGLILAEAVTRSRRPAADTHLVMVVGLVATAIGYELTISHPLRHPETAWVAMIIGGPVVFLAGRARFEYEVFGRVPPSRWVAVGVLLVPVPWLVHAPPLISATLAAVVLGGVAVADARRSRGKPPEGAAPPM
ncbi:low temperature requirement protein A [Micromonospora sp. KC606]|uniref:low temperature requirement protein A n=1 Tax=Micromonospora sp. KC606 TaxID=2530379 RepID=UPI0024435167|nr:low temperature requirement protein A [Micromonospora sp. KC606]